MSTNPEDMEGLLNDEDDDTTAGYLGLDAPTGGGGLSALDMPGAAEALAKMARSSQQARAALQRAREQIVARRYPKALPWFEIAGALSKPTTTGSIGETFGNLSQALAPSIREREAFKQGREKELLGIDTQIAGLDQSSAQAELQLAALRAKLGQAAAQQPLEKVIEGSTPTYRTRMEARGKPAWTPPGSTTSVNVNTQKKFMENLGEGVSKLYTEQFQAALKAPQELERNARVRDLLEKGAYTGMGANWKLAFDRALSAANIDFGGDKIANTEQLGSELAAGTLALIKPSGLGGGTGFSNADRDFLEKVAGGVITLNRESLMRLSKLHDRAQRNIFSAWNDTYSRLTKVPGNAQELATMGLTPLELPPELGGKSKAQGPSPDTEPPPETQQETPAGAQAATPYGLVPAEWAVDPANPPPRASPKAEAALRANPGLARDFLDKYGYLLPEL